MNGGKGDLSVIQDKRVSVHVAIMHNPPIEEPRPTKKNMTSVSGNHIMPNFILIILPNTQGN